MYSPAPANDFTLMGGSQEITKVQVNKKGSQTSSARRAPKSCGQCRKSVCAHLYVCFLWIPTFISWSALLSAPAGYSNSLTLAACTGTGTWFSEGFSKSTSSPSFPICLSPQSRSIPPAMGESHQEFNSGSRVGLLIMGASFILFQTCENLMQM